MLATKRANKTVAARFPIAYIRVSTDLQSNSVESQITDLSAYFARQFGVELVRGINLFVDEARSGKNMNRPAITEALTLIDKRAVSVFIACKVDRITRDIVDGELFARKCDKTATHILTLDGLVDTARNDSRMTFRFALIMAQDERERISSRVTRGMRRLKDNAVSRGSNPYGWRAASEKEAGIDRHNVPLVRDDHEQAILARMQALRNSGMSCQKIADRLNAEGHRNRGGNPWKQQNVDAILRSQGEALAVAA